MFGLERWLKLIDPEPVLINQEACLRARHARSQCRACSETCPVAAFRFENRKLMVDPDLCTRCGLCSGVCPTEALQVRGIDETALQGATVVRCAKASGEGVTVPCLGYLSRDHLIDLGSAAPGVRLIAGDCAGCGLSQGGARAERNAAEAAQVLEALGAADVPRFCSDAGGAGPAQHQAMSRRELLSLWRTGAVQTGRSLLPERDVNPVRLPVKVPARRVRWLKRFIPPEQSRQLHWPSRQIVGTCIACNLCVGFCPTGALASRTEEAGWTLSFQPAACVDCQTCVTLCPRKAIIPGDQPTVHDIVTGVRRDLVTATPPAASQRHKWGLD